MMGHKFVTIHCVYDTITVSLCISLHDVWGAVHSSRIEIEKKLVRIQVAMLVMAAEYCLNSSIKTETNIGNVSKASRRLKQEHYGNWDISRDEPRLMMS